MFPPVDSSMWFLFQRTMHACLHRKQHAFSLPPNEACDYSLSHQVCRAAHKLLDALQVRRALPFCRASTAFRVRRQCLILAAPSLGRKGTAFLSLRQCLTLRPGPQGAGGARTADRQIAARGAHIQRDDQPCPSCLHAISLIASRTQHGAHIYAKVPMQAQSNVPTPRYKPAHVDPPGLTAFIDGVPALFRSLGVSSRPER